MEARAVVVIGYGFGDDHINKMLTQSLKHDGNRRIVVVANVDEGKTTDKATEVAAKLAVDPDCITIVPGTAKSFLDRADIDLVVDSFLPEAPKVEF